MGFIGAGWSSPVARQAHNLKVVGSNPTPATKSKEKQALDFQGLFIFLPFQFDPPNRAVIY